MSQINKTSLPLLEKQGEDECGAYALSYALTAANIRSVPKGNELAREVTKRCSWWNFLSGTRPWDLIDSAKRLSGQKVQGRCISGTKLERMNKLKQYAAIGPVITLIEGDSGQPHYVVVLRCLRKKVRVYDPNYDFSRGVRVLSSDEFYRRWSCGFYGWFFQFWCLPIKRIRQHVR